MKEKFAIAGSPYTLSVLGKEHAREMAAFYSGLQNPFYFSGYIDGADHNAPETWERILRDCEGDGDNFALWHSEKIIGATGIAYKEVDGIKVAVFSGSQIADDYLGRGLSKHLYDVRLQHLCENNFEGRVETYIKPGNIKSMRAAKRNGFADTGNPYPPHPDHNIVIYTGDRLPSAKLTLETLDAQRH